MSMIVLLILELRSTQLTKFRGSLGDEVTTENARPENDAGGHEEYRGWKTI